jgi:hypothetical protein
MVCIRWDFLSRRRILIEEFDELGQIRVYLIVVKVEHESCWKVVKNVHFIHLKN